MIIYKHTCIISNKSYIGKTKRSIEQRFFEHISSSKKDKEKYTHFEYALRKYSKENFISVILEENIPPELINEREKYWIDYYKTFTFGYNMTEGGDGGAFYREKNGMFGKSHSKEAKEKIGKSSKIANSGENSYRTRTINIYNQFGKLQYISTGSFKKFCYENNLPHQRLEKSINDNLPIYRTGRSKAQANRTGNFKFISWYAQKT